LTLGNAWRQVRNTRFKLDLSPHAREDISRIAIRGAEEWGKVHARRYMADLDEAIDNIQRFPYLGHQRDGIHESIRAHTVSSHVIFYRVHEETHEIEVIRVLHGRMDASRHLDPS